jgi:hypothetical protein
MATIPRHAAHTGENAQLLRSARPTPLRRTTRVRLRSSDLARLASERFDQRAGAILNRLAKLLNVQEIKIREFGSTTSPAGTF